MVKEVIRTGGMLTPKLPISQAVRAGGMLYCSGAVPIDPATGKLVQGDIEVQTEQVLRNLGAVLGAAGSGFDKVVKATVFLRDRRDFAGMNRVFQKYFPEDPPARTTVQAELMVDARVEIELIAIAG